MNALSSGDGEPLPPVPTCRQPEIMTSARTELGLYPGVRLASQPMTYAHLARSLKRALLSECATDSAIRWMVLVRFRNPRIATREAERLLDNYAGPRRDPAPEEPVRGRLLRLPVSALLPEAGQHCALLMWHLQRPHPALLEAVLGAQAMVPMATLQREPLQDHPVATWKIELFGN